MKEKTSLFNQLIKRIQKNDPTLKEVDLTKIPLSLIQSHLLSSALRQNKTIESLDLSQHRLKQTPTAINFVALFDALKGNQTLKTLKINYNTPLDMQAIQALADWLAEAPSLQRLELNGVELGDEGCRILANALKKNKTLQRLELEGNLISDDAAVELANAIDNHPSLLSLYLGSNNIFDKGAAAFAQLLTKTNTLIDIDFSDNTLRKKGANALCQAFAKNPHFGQMNVKQFLKEKNALDIVSPPVIGLGLAECGLSEDDIKDIAKWLPQFNFKFILELWRNKLDDATLQILSKALKESQIYRLGMDNTNLSGTRLTTLLDALQNHPTLVELSSLNQPQYTADDLAALANFIAKNHTLKTLRLPQMSSEKELLILLEGLKKNYTLLAMPNFEDDPRFKAILLQNKNLKKIIPTFNQIEKDNASYMSSIPPELSQQILTCFKQQGRNGTEPHQSNKQNAQSRLKP